MRLKGSTPPSSLARFLSDTNTCIRITVSYMASLQLLSPVQSDMSSSPEA